MKGWRERKASSIMKSMQYSRAAVSFGRPWTPAVRGLILANGFVFLLELLDRGGLLVSLFGLDTTRVFGSLLVWQLVTYMFLHGGVTHLLFNMFALWMFGSEVEDFLGRREFLFYYFLTGIGAGFCVWAVDALRGFSSVTAQASGVTIGASGAVFGVLLAYGVLFSRRQITLLVGLVFPVTMEARILVMVYAAIELLMGVQGGVGISHVGHLGGMAVGWLYFKVARGSLRPYFYGRRPLAGLMDRLRPGKGMSDRERLDQILDKINRYGIHTLTERERKFLSKMSKRAH
jgi:membrane associated rhomboid family serine protease